MLENAAHLFGDRNLALIIRPVDFGDDRRHHWRSRRHLDNLGVAAGLLADRFDRIAHRYGDLVALARALVLIDEVDLNVSRLRRSAQIVLANEAVEIDRTGGAGIGLVIHDFRHLGDLGADLAQHARGVLEWGADRHVEDDLEFTLVVEGQHFEDNELDAGQADRAGDKQKNDKEQLETCAATAFFVEERRQHAAEKTLEFPGFDFFTRAMRVARRRMMRLHQQTSEPGRHDEGDGQRNEHSH